MANIATKRHFGSVRELNAEIESFAKADTSHYSRMTAIIAGCVLHAADHGDCDPLSYLFRKVSEATQTIIKRSIRETNRVFGKDHIINGLAFPLFSFETKFKGEGPNNGQPTFFFTKVMRQGQDVLLDDETKVKEIRTDIRAAMSAVDDASVERIIRAEVTANNQRTNIFDGYGRVIKLVKDAAKVHGLPKSDLATLNSILPKEKKLNVDDLWSNGANPTEYTSDDDAELQRLLAKKEASQKAKAEETKVEKVKKAA